MKSIEKKMKIVEERVKRLKDLAAKTTSFERYQASQDAKDMAERNIQVAIEACLDIGKIIISKQDLREPKDNKGIFTVIAEVGILSEGSLSALVQMAGTRNVLVHGYDRIEDSIMYGILKRHVDDFVTFLREVKNNYLEKKPREES